MKFIYKPLVKHSINFLAIFALCFVAPANAKDVALPKLPPLPEVKEVQAPSGFVTTDKEEETTVENTCPKVKIPIVGDIKDTNKIKEITYKIDIGSYNQEQIPSFLTSQRTIYIKDGIVYIKINHRTVENQSFPYPPKFRSDIKPNNYVDFDSQSIKNLSKTILKTAPKDSYKISKELEKYVYKNISEIENKSSVQKASETLKNKKGDSSDKAILLAALLRKSKIPAKIIIGLKYQNAPTPCFYYHPWVIAQVGDTWINLDASTPTKSASSVDYIALADADIALTNPVDDLFENYLRQLSKIKITILNLSLIPSSNISEITPEASFSDMGLLEYLRNSTVGEDLSEKKNFLNNRNLLNANNKEIEENIKQAYLSYKNNDIDETIYYFNEAFSLIPNDDDWMNVDYASKLNYIGFISLAKSRLSYINNHKIWESKTDTLYKMYLPKVTPSLEEEKTLTSLLSQISYSPEIINIRALKATFGKKYKKSDYVNYILAKACYTKKDYKGAQKYINKAMKLNSSNYLYQILNSNILIDRKQYTRALFALNKLNATTDRELEHWISAQKTYILAQKSIKQTDKNLHLAEYYVMNNKPSKAKELLLTNTTLQTAPSDYNLLGKIYFNEGNFDKAKKSYELSNKNRLKNSGALEGFGDLAFIEKNYTKALDFYEKSLSKNKKSEQLMLKIAHCNKELAQENEAIKYYQNILNINPYNYHALFNLGKLNEKINANHNFKNVYYKVLAINSNYQPAWIELIKDALLKKDSQSARQYLLALSHLQKENPAFYYYSGLIEVLDKNYSYARKDFYHALQLDENFTPAKIELEKLK